MHFWLNSICSYTVRSGCGLWRECCLCSAVFVPHYLKQMQWSATLSLLNSTIHHENARRRKTLKRTLTIVLKKNTEDTHILCYTEFCFIQEICLLFPRICKTDSKSVTTLVILSRMEKPRKKNIIIAKENRHRPP